MLSTRLVIVIVLFMCVTAPVAVIGSYYYFSYSEDMLDGAEARNETLVKSLAKLINAHMQQPIQSLRQVLLEDYTNESAHRHPGLLDAIVDQTDFFKSIFVVDHSGVVVDVGLPRHLNALRSDLLFLDFRGHELFEVDRVGGEPIWSDVTSSFVTGNPVVSVALGKDETIVIGNFSLDFIKPIFTSIREASQQDMMLVDGRGVVILSTDQRMSDESVSVANYEIVQLGLQGRSGSLQYNVGNKEKIGSVSLVPNTGWMVVVQQDVQDAVGGHNHIWINAFLVILAFLFGALVFGFWVSSRIDAFFSGLAKLTEPYSGENRDSDENKVPLAPPHLTQEFNAIWKHIRYYVEEEHKRMNSLKRYNAKLLQTQEGLTQASQLLNQQDRVLRLENAAMERLMSALTSGIITIDGDANITYCNRSALQVLSYTNEHQLIGRNIRKLVSGSNGHRDKDIPFGDCPLPCASNPVHTIHPGRNLSVGSKIYESVFSDAAGQEIPVHLSIAPLCGEGESCKEGERVGCVILFNCTNH